MTRLFKRRARVTIGEVPGQGVEVSDDFRISFSVDLSASENSNSIRCELYNLNESTRRRIRAEGKVILIEAGYEGLVETLSIAQVKDDQGVKIVKDRTDVITTIEAMDGLTINNDIKVSLSFEAGYPVRNALTACAGLANLPLRFAPGIIVTAAFSGSAAYSGSVKTVFGEIMKRLEGLAYTIQDDAIIIYQEGRPTDLTVVRLTPQTGLIGWPEQYEGELSGWTVQSLLNPKIRPGVSVSLESRQVNGLFIADRVRHAGDTRSNEWTTTCDLIERT